VRCTPMRPTHEIYAREVHAHEMHAREMHAYEIHTGEIYAYRNRVFLVVIRGPSP
jgi:hypothetical protein